MKPGLDYPVTAPAVGIVPHCRQKGRRPRGTIRSIRKPPCGGSLHPKSDRSYRRPESHEPLHRGPRMRLNYGAIDKDQGRNSRWLRASRRTENCMNRGQGKKQCECETSPCRCIASGSNRPRPNDAACFHRQKPEEERHPLPDLPAFRLPQLLWRSQTCRWWMSWYP